MGCNANCVAVQIFKTLGESDEWKAIALGADDDEYKILRFMTNLFILLIKCIKGLLICKIVYKEDAMSTLDKTLPQRLKTLLSS